MNHESFSATLRWDGCKMYISFLNLKFRTYHCGSAEWPVPWLSHAVSLPMFKINTAGLAYYTPWIYIVGGKLNQVVHLQDPVTPINNGHDVYTLILHTWYFYGISGLESFSCWIIWKSVSMKNSYMINSLNGYRNVFYILMLKYH